MYAVPEGTVIKVPDARVETKQNGSTKTTTTTTIRLEPNIVGLNKSGNRYVVVEEYFTYFEGVDDGYYQLSAQDAGYENAFYVMSCLESSSSIMEDINTGGGAEGSSIPDTIDTIAFFVPTAADLQSGFPGASSTDKPAASSKPIAPSAPAPATNGKPAFTDVAADSPYAEAISWAVAQGITNGKTATTFGTKDICTISHILTFLWRANGKPGAKEGEAERDSVLRWANGQGMVVTAEMLPSPCTRARAVNFMWLAAGKPAEKESTAFTDVYPDDFTKGIAWAVEKRITQGTRATTFSPDAICTRGQIVTFLYRAFK